MTRRERGLLGVLLVLIAVVVAGIGWIQIFGARMGQACVDSYSCRGFLIGGSECLAVAGHSYCTLYCRTDARCPTGWHCLSANPTVLRVETRAVAKVCIRDADR